MSELKPCPFCRSTDLLKAELHMRFVSCIGCGAFGPTGGQDMDMYAPANLIIADAHDRWNAAWEDRRDER